MEFKIQIAAKSDYTIVQDQAGYSYPGPHVEFFDPVLTDADRVLLRDGEQVQLVMFHPAQLQPVPPCH